MSGLKEVPSYEPTNVKAAQLERFLGKPERKGKGKENKEELLIC